MQESISVSTRGAYSGLRKAEPATGGESALCAMYTPKTPLVKFASRRVRLSSPLAQRREGRTKRFLLPAALLLALAALALSGIAGFPWI
jgi:hypothetical protein